MAPIRGLGASIYFYPRPPRGGRHDAAKPELVSTGFLSTPSARRATIINGFQMAQVQLFLSTPSARRATRTTLAEFRARVISIHALREEGDLPSKGATEDPADFYPRPPRGGRQVLQTKYGKAYQFLSTPSARRATC